MIAHTNDARKELVSWLPLQSTTALTDFTHTPIATTTSFLAIYHQRAKVPNVTCSPSPKTTTGRKFMSPLYTTSGYRVVYATCTTCATNLGRWKVQGVHVVSPYERLLCFSCASFLNAVPSWKTPHLCRLTSCNPSDFPRVKRTRQRIIYAPRGGCVWSANAKRSQYGHRNVQP